MNKLFGIYLSVILFAGLAERAYGYSLDKGQQDSSEVHSPPSTKGMTYPLGYQKPVEFYHSVYDTPEKKENEAVDQRETIYWNPALQPDMNGKASFSFYTADEAGTYSIIVEGISYKGEIVREVKKLRVIE